MIEEEYELPLIPGWLSVSEAARRLGVSRQAVHKMAHGRRLHGCRVPGAAGIILINEQDVEEMASAP